MATGTQVKSTRHTCTILSLVGLIIQGILGLIFFIIGICIAAGSIAIPTGSGTEIISASTYAWTVIFMAIFILIPPIIFYLLWRSAEKNPNKRIMGLPICAIIFGGIFNLIAGILALINNADAGSDVIDVKETPVITE